eukprot:TRINITY_DN35151_c0_g1_i1.p1 TRINITY_DN35151_c0_g1~~TRINITY_DN35151_c0_g1_i1.p1  ORF type:complete len:334 (+),score=47.55 TRINITY_DN35151_c0_g1_i1:60-1061(+)
MTMTMLHAVQLLLHADPKQLRNTVPERDLRQLASHLGVCLAPDHGSVIAQCDLAVVDSHTLAGMRCAEILGIVFSFADIQGLAHVFSTASQWQNCFSATEVWRLLVHQRWPGTVKMASTGLAGGDFMKLFRDRHKLEAKRMSSSSSHLAGFRKEDFEHRNTDYYANYALLVELTDEDGPLFDAVFDLWLVDLREEGDMLKGSLSQSARFRRSFEFRRPTLHLSLTVIRRSDCKYVCLCSNEATIGEESSDSHLKFRFHASIPPRYRNFFPSPYFYTCQLDELEWDEDLAGLHKTPRTIHGFRQLRIWCAADKPWSLVGGMTKFGVLHPLWDAQ